MTNQDLSQKLSTLKHVSPSQEWLDENRVLLLAQISNSGAQTLPTWKVAVINFTSFTKAAARPATAFAAFLAVLFTGSIYSQQIFASAKPNDSLYIARIISEQVRLNTTIDSTTRDKLAVQYASSHAQDISNVLANPEFNKEENKDRVEELNNNFKAEVATVKQRIERLGTVKVIELPAPVKDNAQEIDSAVIIADSTKDNQGIQVQENINQEPSVPKAVYQSSGSEGELSATTNEVITEKSDTDKILDEVELLFEAKDYNKASERLQEVNNIINK